MKMNLAATLLIIPTLLVGCSSQKQPASGIVAVAPTPTAKPAKKLPFEPVDLSQTPVSTQKGEVVIEFHGGEDPYISNYRILATALLNDKKSQMFRLNRTMSVLSSSYVRKLVYSRRNKILSFYSKSSMAGPGVLDESRIVCRGVTDAIIFKKAALKKDGDLKQFGCACQITDLLKSKNGGKK
jgi:hypothetical protein